MNFLIEKNALLDNLNKVSKAITGKSTIDALKGILIQVMDGKIIMMGSDMDLSIIAFGVCEVIEPGSILVDAKILTDIVRKLPNDKITIQIQENMVNISCQKSEFTIVKMDENTYPKFPEQKNAVDITVSKEILKNMIGQVHFAISQDDSRPILRGILFEIKEKMLRLVALDGYRLAYTSNSITEDMELSAVIDGKSLYSISRLMDNAGDVKLSLTNNHIQLKFNNVIVASRLLEGKYIAYETLLPAESELDITMNRSQLLGAIDRCTLITTDNPVIKIKINENKIIDVFSDSKRGKASEQLVCSDMKGSRTELDIAFNGRYLLDILNNIECTDLIMKFKNGVSPCICCPSDNPNIKQLILPVRLSSNNK